MLTSVGGTRGRKVRVQRGESGRIGEKGGRDSKLRMDSLSFVFGKNNSSEWC